MSLLIRKDKDKQQYYGFEFMWKGKRYSKTFWGLSKEEVMLKEAELRLALKNNVSNTNAIPITHTLKEAVEKFKEHAYTFYTRPKECFYVIDI